MSMREKDYEMIKYVADLICNEKVGTWGKIFFVAGVLSGMYSGDHDIMEIINRVNESCSEELDNDEYLTDSVKRFDD